MNTVSIGYHRMDGDFALLATLNNKDEDMPEEVFAGIVVELTMRLQGYMPEHDIVALERDDAPDYVEL